MAISRTDVGEYDSSPAGMILDAKFIDGPYSVQDVPGGIEINGRYLPADKYRASRRAMPGHTVSLAVRINERLRQGGLLLGWEQRGFTVLSADRAAGVLIALTSEAPVEQLVSDLEALGLNWVKREDWQQLLDQCALPPALVARYVAQQAAEQQALQAAQDQIEWPLWKSRVALYLVTMSGMAACVFALGTVLTFRPTEQRLRWRDVNPESGSGTLVIRSVLLLAMLGLVDLIATSLSNDQTAGFLELNPFGAAIVSTPLLLAAFKIGATLASGGILLALRRYHGAQIAAWWLAVFCTVLGLRWVTFNSMFLTA